MIDNLYNYSPSDLVYYAMLYIPPLVSLLSLTTLIIQIYSAEYTIEIFWLAEDATFWRILVHLHLLLFWNLPRVATINFLSYWINGYKHQLPPLTFETLRTLMVPITVISLALILQVRAVLVYTVLYYLRHEDFAKKNHLLNLREALVKTLNRHCRGIRAAYVGKRCCSLRIIYRI